MKASDYLNNKIMIGCCYYPEHWDEQDMPADIAKIKDLGFNTIRMGEFAWSSFEKEEGKYDFSFLLNATREAAKYGINVILGTPTAAPPKWLTDKHPEVLVVTEDGKTLHHGSRQHHNHTSEIYIEYCAKIVEAMVKCFKDEPNVIGWQLDNEFNCHRYESFAESDNISFRKWLSEKYGTIDQLNKAWGTKFWSMEYSCFEQIDCPNNTTTHKNPSIVTDYYLFLSDTVVNYATVQTKIIRKYMPDAFVTHNGLFANVDYKKLTDTALDFISFDNYPSFRERERIGDSRLSEYNFAKVRGLSEEFLILEQQSGPGGQLSYMLQTPLPGQIRLWTYQAFAHGAVGVLYFRYRTALYGAEQLWNGIYDHSGVENYRSKEVRKTAKELERIGHIFLNNKRKTEVAIYNDYHNTSCTNVEKAFRDDSRDIYNSLTNKNITADIIFTLDNLSKYKVLIIPHIAIADESFAEKVDAFARNGGVVIISARSGVKDKNAQYRPLKSPGVFGNVTGSTAEWYTMVPKHTPQTVEMYGKEYKAELYYEILDCENSIAIGNYTNGFAKGKPAVTKNGNVYYLGFYSFIDCEIYYDIIKKHLSVYTPEYSDLEVLPLGEDYTVYFNYSQNALPLCAYDIISETNIKEIEPFGVVIKKEN